MLNKKILVVIQARCGSSRLHDKIFLPLNGKPLFYRMYERVSASKIIKQVVIATTTDISDDRTEKFCADNNIECFRGDPLDLLDRHYKAAIKYDADLVVKIPSDCPLICPDVIDNVLNYFINNEKEFDYVSNLHPASHPDGNDVEVMLTEVLKTAWTEAVRDFEREHTTPFIWDNPDRFKIGNVKWETGLDYSKSHRFTIDYKEDYEFIKRIYEELYSENKIFTLCEIMKLLDYKPELKKINEMHSGKYWYNNHLNELKTMTLPKQD